MDDEDNPDELPVSTPPLGLDRGADGIIDTHDTIQLVPLRRTTGVFIGSNDSLHEARCNPESARKSH